MEVTYELNQKDVVEALIAHRNRSRFIRWGVPFAVVLLGVAVFGALASATNRDTKATSNWIANFTPLFALLAVWLVVLWANPRYTARAQFRKQPAMQGEKRVRLDESGFQWESEFGSGHVAWRSFVRWVESRNQVLLYPSPIMFHIVPKRAFTPEQMREVRELIEKNIQRR